MKHIILIPVLLLALCCFIVPARAQSLPVGTPLLEDYYRRMQLSGQLDSSVSFAVRPLFPKAFFNLHNVYDPDSSLLKDSWLKATGPVSIAKGKGEFQVLPFSWQQQFNSGHPYGWNDGLMIPAKGYETLVSGGFFIRIGHLSIQFRPEFVYATNPDFAGFAYGHSSQDLAKYYSYHNDIDMPERFGNGAYVKAGLGQSSIRLTFGAVSAGLSNENLWWGPGIRNSLIMSNTAPGFKHFTLNTVKPIHTPIGSFEGQLIAAQLGNTDLPPLSTITSADGTALYRPRINEWRYFTGLNINYQPKWIPGLFLGLIRAFDAYHSDIKGLGGYFPYLSVYSADNFARDQVTSFYARWLFPHEKAELYVEYGLNDNLANFADFLGAPEHSRAYIFGFRKLFPLSTPGQGLLFNTEITQLSQGIDRTVRDAGSWYTHYQIRQGLTNEGQLLGAGTGPGGNLQSADLSWVMGLKKLGIAFERYEHDADLANIAFPPVNGHSRKWVDLAIALQGDWNYKNFLFNLKIQEVKSLNYQWILKDYNTSDSYVPHNNAFNLHAELGVTFRF